MTVADALTEELAEVERQLKRVEERMLRFFERGYEYAALVRDRAEAKRLRAERDLLGALVRIAQQERP